MATSQQAQHAATAARVEGEGSAPGRACTSQQFPLSLQAQ